MERLYSIVLGLLFLTAPAMGADGSSGRIPDVLYIDGSSFPRWVIAERALTSSGNLDPALFSQPDLFLIEKLFALPADGDCIRLGSLRADRRRGPDRRPDLTTAVRSSDWVFTARITAREGGFSEALPGTLLQIQPVEILKGPGGQLGERFLFVPVGTFSVGSTKFCKTHPLYADLPAVGEEVLLFVDSAQLSHGELILIDREPAVITIHDERQISLPQRYRQSEKGLQVNSRSDLLRFVHQVLREEG